MKLTLGDGRGITMGLPEVLKSKLPVKMGYWFARCLRELGDHMQDMEKAREKLVDEHCKKYTKDKRDPKTGEMIEKKGGNVTEKNQYQFKDPKKFEKAFKELTEVEIEIKYDGVTLEELEKLVGERECPECKKKIPSEVIFRGMDIFNLGELVLDPDGEKKK